MKSVGFLAVISAVYSIALLPIQHGSTGLNQWQEAKIHAQNYLFEKTKIRCAIVGSSMGNRLDKKLLNENDTNLSLGGGDAITGLEIMIRSGRFPEKCVLVEGNSTLFRQADEELLASLFHPVGYPLKSILPMLRENFQPIGLLSTLLKNMSGEKEKPDTAAVNLKELIEGQAALEKPAPDEAEISVVLTKLKAQFEILKQHGIQIYFFDMPRPNLIADGARNRVLQSRIKAAFDSEHYPWIISPQEEDYQTEDALHLNTSSAKRFTALFVKAIDQALEKNKP